MSKEKAITMISVATFGTALTYLFGEFNTPLIVLLIFLALDYVTGVARALINEEGISSQVGFKGLLKKSVTLVVVILGVMMDKLLDTDGYICRTAVATFYIANEGISILENVASMGVPVPQFILDKLTQLKDGAKTKNEKAQG